MGNLKLSPLEKMAFNKFLANNEKPLREMIKNSIEAETNHAPGSERATDRILKNLQNA
jgi:hypothetical protein